MNGSDDLTRPDRSELYGDRGDGAGVDETALDETALDETALDESTLEHGAQDGDDLDVTEVGDDSLDLTEDELTSLATRVGDSSLAVVDSDAQSLDDDVRAAREKGVLVRDRFILLASLGAGGMGHVFQARDIRREEAGDSNNLVAIKFLNAEFGKHSSALVSLQREARKTQELAHPNIVTVYDFDREGDRVFMTMEYLDGAPLSSIDALETKLQKKFDRVEILLQIARGLAYAHSRHYVHSDLKPDNVFITNDGRVKVLDFGIARMTAQAGRTDSFDAGSLGALTPRYASVEMLRGSTEPHPADDVFALGVIGWQLFGGKHPYGRLTAVEALEKKVVVPALQGISGRQRRALTRAIALDRKLRQDDASEFLDDFKGSVGRNRLFAGSAAAVFLASAIWVYITQLPEAPDVPFAALPAEIQSSFLEAMSRGDDHAAIGDWDGALNYYGEAWNLHPRNPDANGALDRVADHLLKLESQIGAGDRDMYLAAIRRLRSNRHLEARQDLADVEARWAD